MEVLEATYRITTPMFLARDKDTAELREASIRGVLRFWFRATALPALGTWQSVKKAEERIFGSAQKGQGGFLLRIQPERRLPPVRAGSEWSGTGSAYLGYGCIGRARGAFLVDRACIPPDQTFSVLLTLRPGYLTAPETGLLLQAMKALGLFGGLGGRSRKGFGSLSLLRLRRGNEELWQAPATLAELTGAVREVLSQMGQLGPDLPEYTAFSQQARVHVAPIRRADSRRLPPPGVLSSPALDQVGRDMLCYRSYGRLVAGKPQTAAGDEAEQTFRRDHDDLHAFASRGALPVQRAPQRAVFGLPHNYFFTSLGGTKVDVNGENQERRASPLFIHIHHLEQGGQAVVFTLLPARFLPQGERLELSKPRGAPPATALVPVEVDWGHIHRFLDRWEEVSLP